MKTLFVFVIGLAWQLDREFKRLPREPARWSDHDLTRASWATIAASTIRISASMRGRRLFIGPNPGEPRTDSPGDGCASFHQ
jgi:hypothetical protein